MIQDNRLMSKEKKSCTISIIHEAFAGFFFYGFRNKSFKFIKDIPRIKRIDIKRGLCLSVISKPKEKMLFIR
jgi:hypothetical protein